MDSNQNDALSQARTNLRKLITKTENDITSVQHSLAEAEEHGDVEAYLSSLKQEKKTE